MKNGYGRINIGKLFSHGSAGLFKKHSKNPGLMIVFKYLTFSLQSKLNCRIKVFRFAQYPYVLI